MEDFVPYELAKKLNEKGFNAEFKYSLGYYDTLGNFMSAADHWFLDSWIAAPTISQVLKWLREEKKISIEVGIHYSLKWMCRIYGFSDGLIDLTQYINNGIDNTVYILYDSYELAALAGIEYIIDNLI